LTGHGASSLRQPYAEGFTDEEEDELQAARETVEGRLYWFETAGISHEVPLSGRQAADLRRNGWDAGEGRASAQP
jgi:hypothetical protein